MKEIESPSGLGKRYFPLQIDQNGCARQEKQPGMLHAASAAELLTLFFILRFCSAPAESFPAYSQTAEPAGADGIFPFTDLPNSANVVP
ncbi:hypothetical protein [Dialister sp.]|uniref:hypothetical protein n=1 Tax=Dialister sp. TaxID=1955814 RepID=UPI003EFBEAD9